jgi:hypothetical protein
VRRQFGGEGTHPKLLPSRGGLPRHRAKIA